MTDELIQQRKNDHLRIVAQQDVEFGRSTLLECVQLVHQALPELNLHQVDTSTEFFGRRLDLPLMITSMTGGTDSAGELNRGLAAAAAECHIAFATGSLRVLLRHPERLPDFAVREFIPEGVLLGNIGGQQLLEYPVDRILGLVELIDADGICVHLNPAHELAQDEGDTEFAGVLEAIGALVEALPGKVLVKEVGCGLSQTVIAALLKAGVNYLDVAGAGGTSWTKVESHRHAGTPAATTGATFSDWGIPTAVCTAGAHALRRDNTTIITSGGIRNGLDLARSIALGADLAGMAKPVFDIFRQGGGSAAVDFIIQVAAELETAMLLTSSTTLAELRKAPRVYTGELKGWLRQLGIARPAK